MKVTILSIIAVAIAGILVWQISLVDDVAPVEILAGGPVIVAEEAPQEGDAFEVSDANIVQKDLLVDVSYSGGCEDHGFKTYATITEFDPPTVGQQKQPLINLFMVHDDPGDPCDSIVNESIQFDLIPILDEYEKKFGEKQAIGFMLQPHGRPFTNYGLQYDKITSETFPVTLVNELPDLGASYTISDARLEGKNLIVSFSSGGGCEEHAYTAYSTALQGFRESIPVQTDIYFAHEDKGDMCEAVVNMTYVFDISSIEGLYKEQYGSKGTIALDLFQFTGEKKHTTLIYNP